MQKSDLGLLSGHWFVQLRPNWVFSERLTKSSMTNLSLSFASVSSYFHYWSNVYQCDLQLPPVICISLTELCIMIFFSVMVQFWVTKLTVVVNSVCMLYNVRCNPFHLLHHSLPGPYEPAKNTRLASSLYSVVLQPFVAIPASSSVASCKALCIFAVYLTKILAWPATFSRWSPKQRKRWKSNCWC